MELLIDEDVMTFEPKSIAEHIECLARLTGASESFVGQVRVLFSNKGIPLDSDATPYLQALDEAFRREESIRNNSLRSRRHLARTRENFRKIGKAYVRQLEQNRRQAPLRTARRKTTLEDLSVSADHRSLVTRPEHDHLPLVPGPDDPQ